MRNFFILSDALGYIDENLCSEFTQEDVAKSCFCSLSSLQKLFKYAFRFTIKDYISKRRLTCAAQDIIKTNMSITNIAMKYQYNSLEVFSRAFYKLWDTLPSNFRKNWKFSGLFPKITDFNYNDNIGGSIMRRKVDISEIYDVLKELNGTYVLCADGRNVLDINKISYDLGDKAILEIAKRLDSVANDDMLLFRIGGDEFALVTGYKNVEDLKILSEKVNAMNGSEIEFGEHKFNFSIRLGAFKMNSTSLRYYELFDNMQNVINTARASENGELTIIEI